MNEVDLAAIFQPWLIQLLRNPSPELLDALAEAVHKAHEREAKSISAKRKGAS